MLSRKKPQSLLWLALVTGFSGPVIAGLKPIDDAELSLIDSYRRNLPSSFTSTSHIDMSKPGSADLMLAMRLLQTGNAKGFRKRLQSSADQKNDYAQYMLANLLLQEDPEANADKALSLLTLSADQENIAAQTTLGYTLFYGKFFAQDFATSLKWSCRAHIQGGAEATMLLAQQTYYGAGTKANIAKAIYWAKEAAALGLPAAEQKAIEWQEISEKIPSFQAYQPDTKNRNCP